MKIEISNEALRRAKRRITGAYLGGHSIVHTNTSYKSLGEQATAYQLEKMEAQATSGRTDQTLLAPPFSPPDTRWLALQATSTTCWCGQSTVLLNTHV